MSIRSNSDFTRLLDNLPQCVLHDIVVFLSIRKGRLAGARHQADQKLYGEAAYLLRRIDEWEETPVDERE